MDKSPKKLPLAKYPVLVAFSLFFLGLFAIDLITPDKTVSELENTTLTQRPALTTFSAEGLNSYFTAYTKYVKDQVAGRDGWIGLQSAVETTLFAKTENGGILLGRDGKMFARTYGLTTAEKRTLPKNIASLEALCQRWSGKVGVMLVPSAATVCADAVPAQAPLLDETAYLKEIAAAVGSAGGTFFDTSAALSAHSGEYIYYRTDHHWTTLGAYYAYEQVCKKWGLTPFDTAAHSTLTAEGFYGTHYSKARTWNAEADTITYYDLDNALTIYRVTGAGQPTEGETTTLYDTEKLAVYDKYSMFLHGNNGLSRIEGDGTGSILVVKDSYANSLVPYLTANYGTIDVVDFRNYNYGLDALIEANGYDHILVLYSFDSFKSDPYFYRCSIAG